MFGVGILLHFGPYLSLETSDPTTSHPSPSDSRADVLLRDIATAHEFREVLRESRCLLFLHVDWSPHSKLGQQKVEQLARLWDAQSASDNMSFFRADLTDQRSDLKTEIRDYLANREWPMNAMVDAGAGSILWLHDGTVVDHVLGAYDITDEELLSRTREVQSQ